MHQHIEILTLYAFGVLSQALAPAEGIIGVTLCETIEGINFALIGASHIEIRNPLIFKINEIIQ